MVGIIAYVVGFIIFSTAKSSIHEGVALMAILNGTVFFVGAGIIFAINNMKYHNNQNLCEDEAVKTNSSSFEKVVLMM